MFRQDIWRFRVVRTVEDCVKAWEAWVSEARPPVPAEDSSTGSPYYHVQLSTSGQRVPNHHRRFDLSAEELELQILDPYRKGLAIMFDGTILQPHTLNRIQIIRTKRPRAGLRPVPRDLLERIKDANVSDWQLVTTSGTDVTSEFITAAPAQPATLRVGTSTPPPPALSPYVDTQIVEAIRAKTGKSTFNVSKLLGLIAELNENYARRNTYASHTLLRAILDHIPPILGCADFKGVANNYSWGRTDRNYIKRLSDFRDQADDALHRQISAKADVLDFDDMPRSVYVDRLLQECAERLLRCTRSYREHGIAGVIATANATFQCGSVRLRLASGAPLTVKRRTSARGDRSGDRKTLVGLTR